MHTTEQLAASHAQRVQTEQSDCPVDLCDPCDSPEGADIPTAADDSALEPAAFEETEPASLMGLVELILKQPKRLERLIRDPALQPELIPKFLAIALVGFCLFGVALSIVLDSADVWPHLTPVADKLQGATTAGLIEFVLKSPDEGVAARWLDGSAFRLILVYAVGLIAATGVCLPSLYFYGLLSGIRMSMMDVTIHALKAKATSAVALIGILPIYIAIGMGMVIFEAPPALQIAALWLGLILPFIGGLWGTHSLYVGFSGLADRLSPENRCRRQCFLRRLVLSWAAVYTAVGPVMIFTLWEYAART
jgi:hypothetical protein